MKKHFSPANLITVTGAVLTVIGGFAYVTEAVNLSVPTLFYGFPIFLGGLALKTTELPPAKKIISINEHSKANEDLPAELEKLIKDVTRWRYGQNAHLESSLKVLQLWDNENPPQLLEIEKMEKNGDYAVRMRFEIAGVTINRWEEKKERLGRFFANGLEAILSAPKNGVVDLLLIPKKLQKDSL
tara:strand:- start:164 stop:718 length:555 start_codon:yes stop_codon:yes gene_type:complete